MAIDPKYRKLADEIERALMDRGLIIEAGWMGFKILTIPPTAQPYQLEVMRNAFFAGAQHVFGSILVGLEEGDDATEADLRRMDNISKELENFLVAFKKRYGLS